MSGDSATRAGIAQLTRQILAADPAFDEARGYLRLDWTLRTATATWLAAAEFPVLAADLNGVAPVLDDASALLASSILDRAHPQVSQSRIALRAGPAGTQPRPAWKAARKGGHDERLIAVSQRVGVSPRAVGTSGSAPLAVAAITSSATRACAGCAPRVVATRGIASAVAGDPRYPVGDDFQRSALDLLERALLVGGATTDVQMTRPITHRGPTRGRRID